MATHDRRRFLPQAIQCFAEQDYDCRELIIVDDGPEPIEDLIPRDPHIQYLWLRSRRSIGAKRNLAAEVATGEYFICWDDDDWFGPHRITYQVTPMLTQRSDATVLLTGYMLDLIGNSFWRQDSVERTGLFRQGASWGTLAWSRKWWKKGLRFPDGSLGEDVALQELLVRHGARIVRLPNDGASIYVRHGKNSWQFPFNKAYAEGWRVIDPPPFLPESALRYYGFSPEQSRLPRGEFLPEEAAILTQQIRKVVNA
jgi:glycosyltransferase involved in cell wall biosynthesis